MRNVNSYYPFFSVYLFRFEIYLFNIYITYQLPIMKCDVFETSRKQKSVNNRNVMTSLNQQSLIELSMVLITRSVEHALLGKNMLVANDRYVKENSR